MMKLVQIKQLLNLKEVSKERTDYDFTHVFASDLMSDALAMISEGEKTIFLTGLCHEQSLRTAEMLDVPIIIYVRDKQPNDLLIEKAQLLHIAIYQTNLTMFEACGRLYEMGLRS